MARFEVDVFVQFCLDALTDADPVSVVREVVLEAVSDSPAIQDAYPVPVDVDDDGLLHRSSSLLIAQGVFPRRFRTGIHNHNVTAVIGAWAGYEDNHFYRRGPESLEVAGVERVHAGEVVVLAPDVIHDVHAPISTWSGALHVYLGDLIGQDRSFWTGPDAAPSRFDGDKVQTRWTEAAIATGLARTASKASSGPAPPNVP